MRKKSPRPRSVGANARAVPPVEPEGRPEAAAEAIADQACFPIVGIGASAGGLAAFEAFFSGMPADSDPGMAFVLVQHLAPDHKSLLTDLVSRYTRLQVFEVEDGMTVRRNCAYIIPPNRDIALLNGTLQLLDPAAPRGRRLPIDFFFHSLAHDQGERAIGVVLSGTGSDGTLGARAIKGGGGLVMVQTPATTEFDGMPRSVLAAGLADFDLAPAAMPARLMSYSASLGHPPVEAVPGLPSESLLKKIFVLLRAQTGHDFSGYKGSTIARRIERRMAVQQIEGMADYVKFLQATPAEVEALFRDLLIGVTSFFRDPEAFRELEQVALPQLLADNPPGSLLRFWSAGCSTGEEAYSLAILLVEQMEARKQSHRVQVFATDIDARAVATARGGLYPASIAADISPERLARFFTAEPGGTSYRIHKRIRDLLVFSEHDVIKDPPFSRLDLISCRNLMIYLGSELQRKLIPMFHYALNPNGVLFLGTSEALGESSDLFLTLSRKRKLYQRKDSVPSARPPLSRFLPPAPLAPVDPRPASRTGLPAKPPLQALTEGALLAELVPVAALVNARGEILYIHGLTGLYLQPTPGEVGVSHIVKMARQGLRQSLRTALHEAVTTQATVRRKGLRVRTNGHFTTVNLTVRPLPHAAEGEGPLYLVILEEASSAVEASAPAFAAEEAAPDLAARLTGLQDELRIKEEHLQGALEEQETSNRELKSFNEEMQSVNEELQSTNEELETAKEEMQSVNEELNTVNSELQAKVLDLTQANNDMSNLLAGTGIATVFLDHQRRILRFTPAAARLINLIPVDIGRPIDHIVSNFSNYTTLSEDTKVVLDTLVPREVEVSTKEGGWFRLRIQPYRTLENVIEGAVLTFIDITEMKMASDALHEVHDQLRLAVVVRDAHDAITVQDLDGKITAWNPGAVRLYGWSEREALGMNVRDRVPVNLRPRAMEALRKLGQGKVLEPSRTRRLAKDGTLVEVSLISTPLVDASGRMYAIATTERAVGAGRRVAARAVRKGSPS